MVAVSGFPFFQSTPPALTPTFIEEEYHKKLRQENEQKAHEI